MSDQSVATARADAARWQVDARNRSDAPSTDDLDREKVWALGCPGAATAAGVLGVTPGWRPVPLDDNLKPSGPPLASYGAVYEHYRNRHRDGTGISLGVKPGATLVAVRGTAKSWSDWCREHAIESSAARHEDGSGAPMLSYRDMGHFASVSWQPPATGFRTSGVALGRAELNAAAESMRPRHVGAQELGWLMWAIPADRPLTFPASRKLGKGLNLIGEGLVPLHAVRADGWRVRPSALPVIEEMPDWLIAEFGGRWGKPRAA